MHSLRRAFVRTTYAAAAAAALSLVISVRRSWKKRGEKGKTATRKSGGDSEGGKAAAVTLEEDKILLNTP